MSAQMFSDEKKSRRGPAVLINKAWQWGQQNRWKRIASIPLLIISGILYPLFWIFYHGFHYISGYAAERIKPPLTNFIRRLENGYREKLDYLLNYSGIVISSALILFLMSLPLYNYLGGEFFPKVDQNRIILEVQREPGVNLFELERTFTRVENIIRREVPEAKLIVSDYGDKEGIEGADRPGGYQGTVRIELVPSSERNRSQFEITDQLLNTLDIVPGAEISEVDDDPLNPEGESGLIVQIFGYGQEQKQLLTEKVKNRLQNLEGINNIYTQADQGRPELRVSMDRERISRLGMNTNQVATALSNAIQGNIATHFVDQGVEHEVVVQLDPKELGHSAAIREIQIKSPDGQWMPLSNIAQIERYQGPTRITRINQQRVSEIQADLAGIDLRSASEKVNASLSQMDWPEGYRYELGGTAEEQQQSFYYLIIAFIIAGILTYMVMASQFESLTEPFIIIFTIPLALTGVLLMLWITQTPISVTSMVGLILLSGIVVNNGIVMIDYIKILQIRRESLHDAIVHGATRRLRPILMTACTTILSMVPLALELGSGSETWSPMARTVIGGLTMSTLLMLFVVPCMYNVLNTLQQKLGMDTIRKIDPLADARVNEKED
jgi:HAE1 family hydrophobic/amphiphilic exporter-1